MAYIKSQFRNGNILTARHMNHIYDNTADLVKSREQQGTIVPADYLEDSPVVQNYIRNRPFWYYSDFNTYTWDGKTILVPSVGEEGLGWIEGSESWEDFSMLDGQEITYKHQGELFTQKITLINSSNYSTMEIKEGVYVYDIYDVYEGQPNLMAYVVFINKNTGTQPDDLPLIGIIQTKKLLEMENGASSDVQPGFYSFLQTVCETNILFASFDNMSLHVEQIFHDTRYTQFFNEMRSKSYAYAVIEDKVDDYSQYPAGSVVLIIDTSTPATFN